MHLWTEYEGRTIAGAYTLGKLVRSEGRNGFFTTSDKAGQPAMIRLTESHFDAEELIERWRQVAAIEQQNLIEIERVGKTDVEGVALTFALMEPSDAVLGDVLQERPLTAAETLQVARAVSAALVALHRAGLVHEHLDPGNVLAVGETVKLRSDCVRECVADKEFNTPEGCAELRRKDVQDFGRMLLRCLTLENELQPGANLPEPFYRIIPGALDGSLTLEQIDAVLNPPAAKPAAAPASVPQASPDGPQPASPAAAPSVAGAAGAQTRSVVTAPAAEPAPAKAAPVAGQVPPAPPQAQLPLSFRPRNDVYREPEDRELPLKQWAIYGGAALLVLLLIWHFVGGSKPQQPAPIVAHTAAPARAAEPQPVPVAAPQKPSPAIPVAGAVTHGSGWYVIAYTFNHEAQAQARAHALAERHPGLTPQVFSPRGGAPYYVALGGAMSQAEAAATLRRARRSGMPRDTFIRNF